MQCVNGDNVVAVSYVFGRVMFSVPLMLLCAPLAQGIHISLISQVEGLEAFEEN